MRREKDLRHDWPLILAYHSVSDERTDSLAVRVADFDMQMSWLHRRGYKSMTVGQFVNGNVQKGERVVIITFDDGYADNYTAAFPILKRYGHVATIFLVSDLVDTNDINWFDVSKVSNKYDRSLFQVLTWGAVKEMNTHGIDFGSHSCTHPRLVDLTSEKLWEEVTRSRADIEEKLDQPVVSFCYPHGVLNQEVIDAVEKAGYSCGVVTPPSSGILLSRYTLRRIGIYRHNSPLLFRLKMTPIVRKNYERLRWVRRSRMGIR